MLIFSSFSGLSTNALIPNIRMTYQCTICEEYLSSNPPSYKSAEGVGDVKFQPENEAENLLGCVVITHCGHLYHEACLREWFRDKMVKTCPACRAICPGVGELKRAFPSTSFRDQVQTQSTVAMKAELDALKNDYKELQENYQSLTESFESLAEKHTIAQDALNWRRLDMKNLTEELEKNKQKVSELENVIDEMVQHAQERIHQESESIQQSGVKRTVSGAGLDDDGSGERADNSNLTNSPATNENSQPPQNYDPYYHY